MYILTLSLSLMIYFILSMLLFPSVANIYLHVIKYPLKLRNLLKLLNKNFLFIIKSTGYDSYLSYKKFHFIFFNN